MPTKLPTTDPKPPVSGTPPTTTASMALKMKPMPPETCADLVRIGQRIAKAARRSGLHADGNNVVINDGKAAFQSVFHIHLHVLPRQSGDKLSFAKGMLLRRDPDREETGRILRDALADLDAGQQD